jgi:striatin 1/3/4
MQHTAESPSEEIEQISYTVDASDQQIRQRELSNNIEHSIVRNEAVDDWNFDDSNILPQPPTELAPPRRSDTETFPSPNNAPMRSPPRPHRRKSSGSMGMIRRRSDGSNEVAKQEPPTFKVRFALRGHLDVVRSVIFTGGGSPSEPEICTTGDDGMVKRWIIPSSYGNFPIPQQQSQSQEQSSNLDIQSYFTHRGHEGIVTCLAASPPSASFSTGGRALGDGWVFSGGQDASILVWERGRVDPKARLEGHTDAIWALCVLPAPAVAIFGSNPNIPSGDRILLVSGSADHTVRIWAVSSPPQLTSPQGSAAGGRRGVGGARRHSLSSGSNFPSSPQPSTASGTPFHYTLVHSIQLSHKDDAIPTSISPLGNDGESFVVAYSDSSVLVFDTRTGDEVVSMQSAETYDGTPGTSINAVVVTNNGSERSTSDGGDEDVGAPTGRDGGVEGVVISGHEDRFVRFFDANSGMPYRHDLFFLISLTHSQVNAPTPC